MGNSPCRCCSERARFPEKGSKDCFWNRQTALLQKSLGTVSYLSGYELNRVSVAMVVWSGSHDSLSPLEPILPLFPSPHISSPQFSRGTRDRVPPLEEGSMDSLQPIHKSKA